MKTIRNWENKKTRNRPIDIYLRFLQGHMMCTNPERQGSTECTGDGADANNAGGAKSRTETIHKRIGFKPAPKN